MRWFVSPPFRPSFPLFPLFRSPLNLTAPLQTSRIYSSHGSPPTATNSETPTRTTLLDIRKKFAAKIPLVALTAYDYPSAQACEKGLVDIILVGDSLAMTVLGHDDTTQVTLDEMIHHCKAVARGSQRCFLVGDLPFGSYQISPQDAVQSSFRLVKEGRVESVKVEGGKTIAPTVARIVQAGIPVLGHIGLTPQSKASLGGFRVQGTTCDRAVRLLEDAEALQEAGCWGVVIEAVPARVSALIAGNLAIPTIGIGAGNQTSGQILVQLDMMGAYDRFLPKFCKQYSQMGDHMREAIAKYSQDVRARKFPAEQHSYSISEAHYNSFISAIHQRKMPPISSKNREYHTDQARGGFAETKKPLNVFIAGAGAMGLFLGGTLSKSEFCTVWLLDFWQEMLQNVGLRGLWMKSEESETVEKRRNLQIFDMNQCGGEKNDHQEFPKLKGIADVVLLCCKCQETDRYLDMIRHVLKPCEESGILVNIQNGFGVFENLQEKFGKSRTFFGISNYGSKILEPGKIEYTKKGSIHFGKSLQETQNFQFLQFLELISQQSIRIELKSDLKKAAIQKLIVNACINPLTALLEQPNGFLSRQQTCVELIDEIVLECIRVADALEYSFEFETLRNAVLLVASNTGTNISSMFSDIRRGSKTEVEYINGYFVKMGRIYSIPTPANNLLLKLIRAKESSLEGKSARNSSFET